MGAPHRERPLISSSILGEAYFSVAFRTQPSLWAILLLITPVGCSFMNWSYFTVFNPPGKPECHLYSFCSFFLPEFSQNEPERTTEAALVTTT